MGTCVRENLELIIMLLESPKRNTKKKKTSEQPCGIRHVALTLVAVYF